MSTSMVVYGRTHGAQSFAIVPEFLIRAALVTVAPLLMYEPATPAVAAVPA